MKTFAISIPKPCHEDWNKMTPDAKGAFCASCQKSVYDFSNKTDEEIIAVFEKEEKGKVCGRFTSSQLSRPVVSFEGNATSTMKRLAMFAYALLLVFGASLFNGAKVFGQELVKGESKVKMMGKPSVERIVIENEQETPKPITKCGLTRNPQEMPLGQAIVIEEPVRLTGDTIITAIDIDNVSDIDILNEVINGEAITGEEIEEIKTVGEIEAVEVPEPIQMVAGGVSYVEITEPLPQVLTPDEEEVVAVIETIEETEDVEDVRIIEEMLPVDPIINIVEEPVQVEEEIVVVEEKAIAEEETPEERTGLIAETVIVPSLDLAVKVSPNPSRGDITLTYTLTSDMPVRIDLYDQSGKLIRNLCNLGKQYAGKYNSIYNIGDLRNGTYNAVMITSDRKVSATVVLAK